MTENIDPKLVTKIRELVAEYIARCEIKRPNPNGEMRLLSLDEMNDRFFDDMSDPYLRDKHGILKGIGLCLGKDRMQIYFEHFRATDDKTAGDLNWMWGGVDDWWSGE